MISKAEKKINVNTSRARVMISYTKTRLKKRLVIKNCIKSVYKLT